MASRGGGGSPGTLSSPWTALSNCRAPPYLSGSAFLRCRFRARVAVPICSVPESHAGKPQSGPVARGGGKTPLAPSNSRANLAGWDENTKRRSGCGGVPNRQPRKAKTMNVSSLIFLPSSLLRMPIVRSRYPCAPIPLSGGVGYSVVSGFRGARRAELKTGNTIGALNCVFHF
jgi:hypothetical protein